MRNRLVKKSDAKPDVGRKFPARFRPLIFGAPVWAHLASNDRAEASIYPARPPIPATTFTA